MSRKSCLFLQSAPLHKNGQDLFDIMFYTGSSRDVVTLLVQNLLHINVLKVDSIIHDRNSSKIDDVAILI